MFNRIHTSFHLQQLQKYISRSPHATLPKVLLAPSHNARPTFFLALALPTPLPKPSKAEKQARKIGLCSRGGSLGCRALKCLDGAL
jgi:hypothetical protein